MTVIRSEDVFRDALQKAVSDFNATEEEFRAIHVKREKLQAIVNSLEAVLGETSHANPNTITMSVPKSATHRKRGGTWNALFRILEKAGGALSIREITNAANSSGYAFSEGAIRAALKRRPQTFVENNGMYSLAPLSGGQTENEEATEAAPPFVQSSFRPPLEN